LLSIFPALIFLLSLVPYLPIANLHQAVMDFLRQVLPRDAAQAVEGVVAEVTLQKRQGLLSFGLLATIWAASSGFYAIMQQLNITYRVKEERPFWKTRGIAIVLTILFAILIIGAFGLIVFGGVLQNRIQQTMFISNLGFAKEFVLFVFAAFRWIVIGLLMLAGFALTYYFGPNVDIRFRFITPGAIAGMSVLVVASLAFRFYVEGFSNYAASYGSLGAVIVLMLWLDIAGLVILLGSEINALIDQKKDASALAKKGEARRRR
jgi:membrane protein